MKRLRKVAVSTVSTGMLFAVMTGCDHAPDPYWNSHAPGSPSLPRDVGIRVTDGHLDIWTGSPCREVTRIHATFQRPGTYYYYFDSVDPGGGELERLRYGEDVPGFTPTRVPEPGFDWRDVERLFFVVLMNDGDGMDAGSDLQKVFDNSDKHPEDTYYFQHAGWLDPVGVAAEDGKSFLTLCTPDPVRSLALARRGSSAESRLLPTFAWTCVGATRRAHQY